MAKPLAGSIAVVAGATRGAGRAIAVELGAAGALVYCTGRTTRTHRSDLGREESIEETAELVSSRGGVGIAVQVDHTNEDEVCALFERVRAEQDGRLDILVNDVWGGDMLMQNLPFWEMSLDKGLLMMQRGFLSHVITSRYGAPLMVARKSGLIVELTDGVSSAYRGELFYDLTKASVNRLAFGMAEELRPHGVTALALTPGFLRSEAMLDHFGVTEANWQDGAQRDPHFIASETPYFVARALVALATDPKVAQKSGGAYSSWELSDEYGFSDIDGRRPHWGRYFAEHVMGKALEDTTASS
jgi:NAD(P)-dependent dehydrogenase (short-subunit alcohol dehydrogenase family)